MPIKLQPPVGLPTASEADEEEAWSSLVATQLTDVRKSAENWRNGLVAVIGLVAAFSMIKGPEDVSGLHHWAAVLVGLLLLLALAGAIYGAWSSLGAAYGAPSLVTRQGFRDLGGVNGYRLDLATKAAAKLRHAKLATLATLTFLAAAVGLTWYGPRPPSVTLDVDRQSLPTICGKLVASEDGYIELSRPSSGSIRVAMSDVVEMRVVEKCP